jgi:hypothetical protein
VSSSVPNNNQNDLLFITPEAVTTSPNPVRAANVTTPGNSGLSVRAEANQSLTVRDPRFVLNSTTAVCEFRIKFVGSDGNGADGWSLTGNLTTAAGTQVSNASGLLRVNYDATNGCGVTLPTTFQAFTDYDLQVRVVRSDGQRFGRDDKFNMLFGAFARVVVTGQAV